MCIFTSRSSAGKKLAEKLISYKNNKSVIVLALPRGGVPVAYEVSQTLGAPLDVLMVRKLGVPFHKELAMGALAFDRSVIIDNELAKRFGITKNAIKEVIYKEMKELDRRNKLYRKGQEFPQIAGKIVILIDDGVATGSTMSVSIKALRKRNPAKIVVAIPVGSELTCGELKRQVDKIICLNILNGFHAVEQVYEDFSQTSDMEVQTLLGRANVETLNT